MVKHITHTKSHLKSLARFMQILDGSFPSGIFVHSFGLEPHVIKQKVYDINSLKNYLENLIIDQYSKMEFVVVKKVYDALERDKLPLINKLDNTYSSFLTYEYAKASSDIGFNYYTQTKKLAKCQIIEKYYDLIKNKKTLGNEIVVLSCLAYDLNIDIEDFIVMWTKKNLVNIAVTTLKNTRIKPSDIQQMLFEFDDILEEIIFKNKENKITNFNPLFEEIIFSHKNLEPKMFTT